MRREIESPFEGFEFLTSLLLSSREIIYFHEKEISTTNRSIDEQISRGEGNTLPVRLP